MNYYLIFFLVNIVVFQGCSAKFASRSVEVNSNSCTQLHNNHSLKSIEEAFLCKEYEKGFK